MKFADEAIKNRANASVELDLELVGIGRLSGRKGGTAPGHDWSSPSRRRAPLSAEYFRRRVSAICFSANCWPTFSRTPLKISGFLTSFAATKMNCSGLLRNSAWKAWLRKDQIQSTKAVGSAAPGSNSRSPKPKSSLSAATRCLREAGAILVLCSSATRVQRGSYLPAESAPVFPENF